MRNQIIKNGIIGITLAFILTTTIFIYVKDPFQNPSPVDKFPSSSILYTIENDFATRFGTYEPLAVTLPNNGLDLHFKDDLSDVIGIDEISDPMVLEMLSSQGFAVVESDYLKFSELYIYNVGDYKHFITTDALLHVFHLIYDYSLRYIEVNSFLLALNDFSNYMYEWCLVNYQDPSLIELKDSFGKLTAFFAIGLELLNDPKSPPSELQSLVNVELVKINDANSFGVSEITGNTVDFTQFIVRGHYTRSDELSYFFMAMLYYSQIGYFLHPTTSEANEIGVNQTREALLITSGVLSDDTNQTFTNWEKIFEPTTFYVGQADDLTLYEYITLLEDYTIEELVTDEIIKEIIETAKKLPSPLILGTVTQDPDWTNSTKGFRLIAQRFVPDNYFFQKLVDDEVSMRTMPSGLDIMAVFNSSRALYHQQGEVDQFPEYLPQIETLREEVENWEDEAWTQNLYYLWLYTLLPLLNEKSDQYPTYMRSDAWSDKELNTALGSWAELRHDTILSTKQPYSISPFEEGFVGIVEPNPDLISRLYSLTKLLKEGLSARGLLDAEDPLMIKLNDFEDLMLSFIAMIEKELKGEALSVEERGTIFYIYDR
ncbi:MAG: DUF3160 domain-containing protein, partial [Candidatus Kariarchaeaceae archaeon]